MNLPSDHLDNFNFPKSKSEPMNWAIIKFWHLPIDDVFRYQGYYWIKMAACMARKYADNKWQHLPTECFVSVPLRNIPVYLRKRVVKFLKVIDIGFVPGKPPKVETGKPNVKPINNSSRKIGFGRF